MYHVAHALKSSNMILNTFNVCIIIEISGVKYRVVKGTFCIKNVSRRDVGAEGRLTRRCLGFFA